ncbi:hypothetical protein ABI59_11415 [Acidobacteria bacterium Mor1]|nr:hypothetical protein ABI59_11415 [Acidobacteria bacterium Mor1]
MRTRNLLAGFALICLLAAPAPAQPRISEFDATIPTFDVSGPRTITESGIYRLTRDIESSETPAVVIESFEPIEVVLDLNGFEIRGNDLAGPLDLRAAEGRIRVMNGTLQTPRRQGVVTGGLARSLELTDVELIGGDYGIEMVLGEALRIQRSRIASHRCISASAPEAWRPAFDHNLFECAWVGFDLQNNVGGRIADNRIEIGPATHAPFNIRNGDGLLFLRNTWTGERSQWAQISCDRIHMAGNRFFGMAFAIRGDGIQFRDNEIDTDIWPAQPRSAVEILGDDVKVRGNRVDAGPWIPGVTVRGDRTQVFENDIAAIDTPALRLYGVDSWMRSNRFVRTSLQPYPFLTPVILADPDSDLGDNLCNGEPCF